MEADNRIKNHYLHQAQGGLKAGSDSAHYYQLRLIFAQMPSCVSWLHHACFVCIRKIYVVVYTTTYLVGGLQRYGSLHSDTRAFLRRTESEMHGNTDVSP